MFVSMSIDLRMIKRISQADCPVEGVVHCIRAHPLGAAIQTGCIVHLCITRTPADRWKQSVWGAGCSFPVHIKPPLGMGPGTRM